MKLLNLKHVIHGRAPSVRDTVVQECIQFLDHCEVTKLTSRYLNIFYLLIYDIYNIYVARCTAAT